MPRTRPPYPKTYRQQIVELARAGRSVSQLAEEFEPSGQTIRSWIKQADIDDGAPRIHAELQAEGTRVGLGARRSLDESGGPAWREPPPRRHDHHSKQANNPGQ